MRGGPDLVVQIDRMSPAGAAFDDTMLSLYSQADLGCQEAEVDYLLRACAMPEAHADSIAPGVLEEFAPLFEPGQERLQLWALVLRRKARDLAPAPCQ